MFKLLVDFNENDNDRVHGLQTYAEGHRELALGDSVLLHDDGGEEAWGIVDGVDGGRVRALVDWTTFGPPRVRLLPNGVWSWQPRIDVGSAGHGWSSRQVISIGMRVTWENTSSLV